MYCSVRISAQGAPIKNNPLGKIHYLSYCNRFFSPNSQLSQRRIQATYTAFFLGDCFYWRTLYIRMFVCLLSHVSQNTCPNFTKFSVLVTSTDIKYSLDFLRPIRTAQAFEAVAWLPQRTWPLVE